VGQTAGVSQAGLCLKIKWKKESGKK